MTETTTWPLAPLLALRAAAEERASADAARAAALWRRAAEDVRRRDHALGRAADLEPGATPAELRRAARFLRRCRDEAAAARTDAGRALEALRAAEAAFAAARARREALEAERSAWLRARAKARAEAGEREREDLAGRRAAQRLQGA